MMRRSRSGDGVVLGGVDLTVGEPDRRGPRGRGGQGGVGVDQVKWNVDSGEQGGVTGAEAGDAGVLEEHRETIATGERRGDYTNEDEMSTRANKKPARQRNAERTKAHGRRRRLQYQLPEEWLGSLGPDTPPHVRLIILQDAMPTPAGAQ